MQVFTQSGATGAVEIEHNGDVIPFGGNVGAFTSLDGIDYAAGE